MGRPIDITRAIVGQKVGRLSIIADLGLDKNSHRVMLCVCECGNSKKYVRSDLLTGRVVSCGCYRRAIDRVVNLKHGESSVVGKPASTEYQAWLGMIKRCEDSSRKDWKHYGGRGITVCSRWRHSYDNFLKDMGRKPSPGLTLDRVDVNGNYEPKNCRRATWAEQSNNKRLVEAL